MVPAIYHRFQLASVAVLSVMVLSVAQAFAQEDPVLETLTPRDQSLDWRLEVKSVQECDVCAPIVQMAMEQQDAQPTQCALLQPPLPRGIELPVWTEVDYRQHLDLLREALIETQWSNRHAIGFLRRLQPDAQPSELRRVFWERFSQPILALFENGSAHLETANFSVDGQQEVVFRTSQVKPVDGETYLGPWQIATCDEGGAYPAYYVFAEDPELYRALRRYAREWMTLLNYGDATYLWRRAISSGFVLSLTRARPEWVIKTEMYFAYRYARPK